MTSISFRVDELCRSREVEPTASSMIDVAKVIEKSNDRVLEHVISSVQHIATHMNAKLEESEERVLSKMKTTMADMYEKIDLLNAAVSPGGTKAQDDTTITPDSEDVHEMNSLEFVTQRVSEASRDMEGRA